MKIFPGLGSPSRPADARSFVGPARMKPLASDSEGAEVNVYRVEFESSSRTNWHIHSGPQWLLIVEGAIRVQRWGESPHDVEAGDAVVIPPGEKHWHGAVPGARGVHLAVNVNVTTEWLEPVTDDQYDNSSITL